MAPAWARLYRAAIGLSRMWQRALEAAHEEADHADLHEGEVVDRELLVARGDGPRLLERADRALDGAAASIGHAVELRLAAGPVGAPADMIGALRDHRPHAVPAQPSADRRVAIAFVAREGRW